MLRKIHKKKLSIQRCKHNLKRNKIETISLTQIRRKIENNIKNERKFVDLPDQVINYGESGVFRMKNW